MFKLTQVKVPVQSRESVIKKKITKILGIKEQNIIEYTILKHSIDARHEAIQDVYQIAVSISNEQHVLERIKRMQPNMVAEYKPVSYDFFSRISDKAQRRNLEERPVIIGAGPAGLFCAYELAIHGYQPIIIERGKSVEERRKDVDVFFETGVLNPNSNVQFGEGGAGTFSDGKLNTLVKDTMGRSQHVLETFVLCGANEDILYEQKPHIGTDVLLDVLVNLRKRIQSAGGTFCFEKQVVDFSINNNRICAVKLSDGTNIPCSVCVLAIGHSARDTFETLFKRNISMEAKSFAVGFRVEHPQEMINRLQYGKRAVDLPAAPYKVTATTSSGRGVYSFCMCPGGYVVNASSVPGRTAVNGMSYRKRDGKNANSAIIVSVSPIDYGGKGPLSGVFFQERIEEHTYALAQGKIPQQLFKDFVEDKVSSSFGQFMSATKGEAEFANLRSILPEELNLAFIEGMNLIGNKIPGFNRPDAILSGVESRTSSPIRIHRDEYFQSSVLGLYPCGEGAGYAGGIMSAAMDGMKIAEQIAADYLSYKE